MMLSFLSRKLIALVAPAISTGKYGRLLVVKYVELTSIVDIINSISSAGTTSGQKRTIRIVKSKIIKADIDRIAQ